jgi:hypothetical protein
LLDDIRVVAVEILLNRFSHFELISLFNSLSQVTLLLLLVLLYSLSLT